MMDPWSCQPSVTLPESSTSLKFEDNFLPLDPFDKLPDSEKYLEILEGKLWKIRNDPNILRQLTIKREACMRELMKSNDFTSDLESEIVVSSFLQRQATNIEILHLLKHDQLDTN